MTPQDWNRQEDCGGPEGWVGEESLDVEMVHGLAPKANVLYLGANSCYEDDFLDVLNQVVDNHLADIVSNSWLESCTPATVGRPGADHGVQQTFQLGAVEGISFTFASGDCGDNNPDASQTGTNCDPSSPRAQTDWPASDPWVTAVGATALAISSKAGKYGFETSMGDSYAYLSDDRSQWDPLPGTFYFGGGGGTSEDFDQPGYQTDRVPDALAHTLLTGAHSDQAKRVVPDVAMEGDLIWGTLVGLSDGAPYSETSYGGSSVACPLFAAVLADAIQARSGEPFGLANPMLYAHAGAFRDIVDPTPPIGTVQVYDTAPRDPLLVILWTLGTDTSLVATPGYDPAPGSGHRPQRPWPRSRPTSRNPPRRARNEATSRQDLTGRCLVARAGRVAT